MTNDSLNSNTPDSDRLDISTPEVAAKLDKKMDELHLADNEREVEAAAAGQGLLYINLSGLAISPQAISLIPQDRAQELGTICFDLQGDQVSLGTVNPLQPGLAELQSELNAKEYQINLYLISPHSLEKAFFFYKTVPKIKPVERGLNIKADDLQNFRNQFANFAELAEKIRKVSVTDLVTFLVATAIDSRASDIHIEAEESGIMVRYRIDGILHEIVDLPKDVWKKLTSRIKLLARLKINVNDKPQDGSFSIKLVGDQIDVRVSVVPTNYGESIVIRLLMSSSSAIQFDDLGLRGKAYADLDREIKKPNGMIITTGPTGSGKSTTLYAVLNKLNSPETKIITLEDPIEYKLAGINQSQVNTSEDYTFAKGLRSILRQDPDIIMVGEVRDLDTAETAINAALTGHLVISTLHTNSAAATVPRLLSMNVRPFLLAPALNAMMGQRLVRKICPHCKVAAEIDNRTMAEVIKTLSTLKPESGEGSTIKDINNLKFFKGKGCKECQQLGYFGRVGIFEIMGMTQEIEKLILSGQVSEYQIQEIAVKNGMVTMMQDGLLKALDGVTTVEEVFRVTK
ncbi:MAG: GspE/PulE family protein [Patescibacteria group bacterium]|jgi:type II secretory ATPase GspE/PulE/Tfp pilus assembly ATPase PilB-like protein